MVLDNVDVENRGRLQLKVPDVLGDMPSSWALPCFPFTGIQNGFFVLPEISSPVWVEFEHGNPDLPVWTGCWFESMSDIPDLAKQTPPGVQCLAIQTLTKNTFLLSDQPGPTGGILLRLGTNAMISISNTGIVISNGQGASILLQGNSVIINNGALTIT